MSVDFIRKKIGSDGIALARRQQEQLHYFTKSQIQKEINITYLNQWAERNYISNDYFLNWVKAIFKTENFLAFYKYFRNPLPSADLVNNTIKESLSRVFHAEDSYFNYSIKGIDTHTPDELEEEIFQDKLFNALLFEHNSILVHDLIEPNRPFREFIPIKNVVAIESKDSIISKVCYTATVTINKVVVKGYLYMDKERYAFYNKDFTELINETHDLGVCPADYITKEAFSDNDIVRKSIFSYKIEALEEYVFLKTLRRMTEPNGVIPITTEIDAKDTKPQGNDLSGAKPMSANAISSQQSDLGIEVIGTRSDSPLQAGTRIKVKGRRKNDGSIDMDYVKNFLNFHHLPTAPLEYISSRIKEVEKGILTSVLGDFSEENESQKNELQVEKSYINKQDKLRSMSMELSRTRKLSDYKFLALKHGPDAVQVDCFYGTDFFLESQDELYDLYQKSPNPIERKNLLLRLSQNRNRYNAIKYKKEKILYDLMPFSSDVDFDKAIERGLVDDITFAFQTRFGYYVGMFEAIYGDIVMFWDMIESGNSEKIKVVSELINNIIKQDYVNINSAS